MRTISLTLAAALVLSAQLIAAVRADETTVIRKDNDADGSSTTVIKKHESDDHAVIIKKEHED
jgi:hypothetical protein